MGIIKVLRWGGLAAVAGLFVCCENSEQAVLEYPMLNVEPQVLSKHFPAEAVVILEMIEVEASLFSEWMIGTPLLPIQATALRREVQRWGRSEDARLCETMAVHTRSGQRSSTRSGREIIYPSVYADAMANELSEVDRPSSSGVSLTPITFKMKEVGMAFSVEAEIDGVTGVIDLKLDPSLAYYLENMDWEMQGQLVKSPIFEGTGIITEISLQDGIYGFLGSGRLPEAARSEEFEDPILLTFVRVDSNITKSR